MNYVYSSYLSKEHLRDRRLLINIGYDHGDIALTGCGNSDSPRQPLFSQTRLGVNDLCQDLSVQAMSVTCLISIG